jgi:hypothetical protein
VTIVYVIKWKFEGHSQATDMKEPNLAQLDKVLYEWFMAMHSERKPMTGPMIIEKAKFFND